MKVLENLDVPWTFMTGWSFMFKDGLVYVWKFLPIKSRSPCFETGLEGLMESLVFWINLPVWGIHFCCEGGSLLSSGDGLLPKVKLLNCCPKTSWRENQESIIWQCLKNKWGKIHFLSCSLVWKKWRFTKEKVKFSSDLLVSVHLKLIIKCKMTTDATSCTEYYTLNPIKQK